MRALLLSLLLSQSDCFAPFVNRRHLPTYARCQRQLIACTKAQREPSQEPLRLDAASRRQLGVLLACGMLTQAAIGMIVPLMPAYASSRGLSSSGVGFIVAMPALARVLLNLPLGALVDVARKPPLVIGSLIEGIGSLGTATATSLGAMLPPRLLVGAGSAAATTAAQAYTMDVVDRYPNHKGVLLGR
mmetsp:Transcript_27865/g.56074  ORF Transcript_27865/g.56074 Transcript_27865/m.56074 type:complete len:188 (-) Transcript_27865:691-1254(-)